MSISKSAMTAALVFLLAVVGTPAPTPVPCPKGYDKPWSKCDFFFNNTGTTIPTFNLISAGDRRVSGARLYYNITKNGKRKYNFVEVDSSGDAYYYPQDPNLDVWQFYVQDRGGSRLWARTFNTPFNSYLKKCIILKVPNTYVEVDGKPYNLNPGDGNPLFPQSRRCVVFKTN